MEEFAGCAGVAAVEAEREFVEVVIQVLCAYTSVVRSEQPTLEQSCDPMDAGQFLCRGVLAAMHKRHGTVLVTKAFQAAVGRQAGGADFAAGCN